MFYRRLGILVLSGFLFAGPAYAGNGTEYADDGTAKNCYRYPGQDPAPCCFRPCSVDIDPVKPPAPSCPKGNHPVGITNGELICEADTPTPLPCGEGPGAPPCGMVVPRDLYPVDPYPGPGGKYNPVAPTAPGKPPGGGPGVYRPPAPMPLCATGGGGWKHCPGGFQGKAGGDRGREGNGRAVGGGFR